MLVPVASFVVAAHGIRVAQLCHHAPRRIPEVHLSAHIGSQDASFPHPTVYVALHGCGTRVIVVAEKSRTEILQQVYVKAFVRICQHVARVVNKGISHSEVCRLGVHSFEQLRPFNVLSFDIVECNGRAKISFWSNAEEK